MTYCDYRNRFFGVEGVACGAPSIVTCQACYRSFCEPHASEEDALTCTWCRTPWMPQGARA